jgi:hypothetical protein
MERGARQRKFYVGDSAGLVRLYNQKNAEFLKEVNDIQEEIEMVEKLEKLTFSKRDKKEEHDVTCLLYLQDEKLLIFGTLDSVIKIYDEIDSEESQLLRVIIGGHKESEICALAYSS